MTTPVQYGPRITAIILCVGQFLSKKRTAQALAELFGTPVSEGIVATMTKRTAAGLNDVLDVVADRIAEAEVAGFDETGLRVAGDLHWVALRPHCCSGRWFSCQGGQCGSDFLDVGFDVGVCRDAGAVVVASPLLREPLRCEHVKPRLLGRRGTTPGVPGSIHEGGELGYSPAHAYGAVFDNPPP